MFPRISFPRTLAQFSAGALLANYEAIRAQVPCQSMLPMIKANAYGHGAGWAARTLATMPGLYGFGVATLEEGEEVRKALGARGRRTRIVVLSGTALWTEEKGRFCEKHGLTATVSNEEDWVRFLRGRWHERIAYEIKFNTGMNRLGIPVNYARLIARALRNAPPEAHPSGILSHLATADKPEEKLARGQLESFKAVRSQLEPVCPGAHFHLANSSAIWNAKLWGLERLTDVVRPGISLYGVPPYPGAPARGLHPVLTLKSQIVDRRALKPGETIGYGGSYRARESTEVAILAIGYADGLKRGSTGHVLIGGRKYPFVGIVSMDLSAVVCPKSARPGDWAQILGPGIDPWEQARAAGTIPYEFLTSVAQRVERTYEA